MIIYKCKVLYNKFPQIYEYSSYKQTKLSGVISFIKLETFRIHISPNGNCQNMSMAYANAMCNISPELLKEIFVDLFNRTERRQLLLDILKEEESKILKSLEFVTEKIIVKANYLNNTGNMMSLIILKLHDKLE